MGRALFLLLVGPIMAIGPAAHAQTAGGIQVAPVMLAMSAERNITSLRVRNTRQRAVSFEVDVYAWTQVDGRDVLTASPDLLVAPGVFEIPAGGEQVVRLGVVNTAPNTERAFRIILRELPSPRRDGAALGFTLEMSLPVFITPPQARGELETRVERRVTGPVLLVANIGQTHVQVAGLDVADGAPIPSPRYLLAGARAEIPLPPQARTLRLRTAEIGRAPTERVVHVADPILPAPVR